MNKGIKSYIFSVTSLRPQWLYRYCIIAGTVMLDHVLGICEKDGNYDNVFL